MREESSVSGNRVRPAKAFTRFEEREIEQSIPLRFEQMAEKNPGRLATKDRARTLTLSS